MKELEKHPTPWAIDSFGALVDRNGHAVTGGLETAAYVVTALAERNGVIDEIAAERKRQIEAEGYDSAHDDLHTGGELERAAACYALAATSEHYLALQNNGRVSPSGGLWPWEAEYYKPKSARENLVRADALIVAAIERIDRAEANEG